MTEFSRAEIEKRLIALNDPWLSAAFAARIAMLVLPVGLTAGMTRDKSFLWFWGSDQQEKHLLSMLRACQCVWSGIWLKDQAIARAADAAARAAARAAAAADDDAIADAVAAAARAADADAARAARAAVAVAVAVAARAAAAARRKAVDYVNLIQKNQSVKGFLMQPFDKTFDAEQRLFIQALRQLGKDFDYWADWYEARLRGDGLDEAIMGKSCLLSEEILSLAPQAINAHLKQLATGQSTSQLNRVRAIFIGHGAAGKTSLIRALHGEPIEAGQEDMTPGVEIRSWPVDAEQAIQADLWDFGGQVVAHATHQFFLRSRCVYVLVLAGREEIDANQQAEYWLEHVRSFGDDAPVLLVGNKADLEPVRLDLASLQQHYSNIVGFYLLSCVHYQGAYQAHFDCFEQAFRQQLLTLNEQENVHFAPAHFNVMQAIEAKSEQEATLPKSHFEQLCRTHQIATHTGFTQDTLLKLLDLLGVVIYFPELQIHCNTYVLNPRWLTYGVYSLIYAKQTRDQNGYWQIEDIKKLLGSPTIEYEPGKNIPFPKHFSYPPKKCDFIIEAMEQFKLCYRLDNNRLIIPARLPEENKAALDFDKTHAIAYELEFKGFLPRHIMPSLIVSRHHEIEKELMWQNGVQLRSRDLNAHALVTANYHLRCLSLWIKGTDAVRYFERLLDTVLDLKKNMSHMQMTQSIVLDKKDAIHAPNTHGEGLTSKVPLTLLWSYQQKDFTPFPDGQGNWYDLQEVLHKMPKSSGNTHVNINGNVNGASIVVGDKNKVTTTVINYMQEIYQQLEQCDQKLGALEDLLAIEADDALSQPALKELKLIRNALKTLQQPENEPTEHTDAYEKLSRFADRLKDGSSQLVNALKTIKTGRQAIEWLKENIPPIIVGIANALGG